MKNSKRKTAERTTDHLGPDDAPRLYDLDPKEMTPGIPEGVQKRLKPVHLVRENENSRR